MCVTCSLFFVSIGFCLLGSLVWLVAVVVLQMCCLCISTDLTVLWFCVGLSRDVVFGIVRSVGDLLRCPTVSCLV